MTVFVYQIQRRIHLTLREYGVTTNWNLPMASADYKLYKDVTNNIEFVVRNTDRKPINLVGRRLFVIITDYHTKKVLASKQLLPVDEVKGIMRLSLQGEEMEQWNLGFHAYHIYVENPDGSQNLLYVDQDEKTRGVLELCPGYYPGPQPSIEIPSDQFYPITDNDPPVTYYVSSSMPGNMRVGNTSGLHTLAIYTDNFKGTVWVQGSSEITSSQDPAEWFDIQPPQLYIGGSGITTYTFQMNLQWVRVKYKADQDNHGTFQKLLFRN